MTDRIKMFAAIAAAAMTPAAAMATTAMPDTTVADNVTVERTDSHIVVGMTMALDKIDPGSNEEVTLIPVITDTLTGSRLELPPVTVAGRSRWYSRRRNGQDGPNLYRAGKAAPLRYTATTDYLPWMESSVLLLEQNDCGCAGSPKGGSVQTLADIDFRPKVFAPEFVFVTPVAEAVKTRQIAGQAYVDFPVNRTEIYPDYRRNPAELEKIRRTIDTVRLDPDTRITALSIKGYASPEGPYNNNERLAKGRTAALRDYVQGLYSFPAGLITTSWEAEDWQGLIRYLETSDLAHRDAILAIATSDREPDNKDWKIKSTYPEQYRFLLAEVYPALRHSDYRIEYEVRSYTDVEEIAAVMRSNPGKLSLQELFVLSQTLEPGSDAYTDVFETAVRLYPDDPTANLNAALAALRRNDVHSAERYLPKAGSTPQAVYARGILAAMQQQWDMARSLLTEAAQTLPEAADALGQLENVAPRH